MYASETFVQICKQKNNANQSIETSWLLNQLEKIWVNLKKFESTWRNLDQLESK